MSPQEIIAAVESIGGHFITNGDRLRVEAPKGKLTAELVKTLKQRKPDLIEYLRLAESYSHIEEKRLAIKVVEKDGNRSWWLVASTARSEVDDDAPVYTALEWLQIITSGLAHDEIRTLDRDVRPLKSVFGGEVIRIERHDNEGA